MQVVGNPALQVIQKVNGDEAIVDRQGPPGGAENLVGGEDLGPGVPQEESPRGLLAHAGDGKELGFAEEPFQKIEVEVLKRKLEKARVQAADDAKAKLEAELPRGGGVTVVVLLTEDGATVLWEQLGEATEEENVAITETQRVSGGEAEGNVEELVREGVQAAVAETGRVSGQPFHHRGLRVPTANHLSSGQGGQELVDLPIVERAILMEHQGISDGTLQGPQTGRGEGEIPFAGERMDGRDATGSGRYFGRHDGRRRL